MPIIGTTSSGRNYGRGGAVRLPVWVTSGAITNPVAGVAYSYQLVATDPQGLSLTYTLYSGSLPTGLSISTSGLISGTPSGSSAGFTFTVKVQNAGGAYLISNNITMTLIVISVSSSSTSGANNSYSNYSTNNEIQRQTSLGGQKTITINGAGFNAATPSVTLGGVSCGSVNRVNDTQITCTVPSTTYSSNVNLTVTVSFSGIASTYNSPNTIYTRRLGENVQFPANTGNTIQANGDSQTAGLTQYYLRPSGRAADAFQVYVAGSNYDGGGYDYYLMGTGPAFNYFNQGNSCGSVNLNMWAPRSQACWQGAQAVWGWTTGTGNTGTTYVYKPGGGGGYGTMRQNSYYGGGYDDWRVVDGGRWWLRNSGFGEPNGDYDGYGNLQMYGQSGYEMGFNDGGAYNSNNQYVCSTNGKG